MSMSRRFSDLRPGGSRRSQVLYAPPPSGPPPASASTRPLSHPPASDTHNTFSDPYAALDSWSGSGGTALRGAGPAAETRGMADLPAPPPDYNSAVRESIASLDQLVERTGSVSAGSYRVQEQASAPNVARAHSGRTGAETRRRTSVEDPLSALGRYDLVFLVDDSPSMDDPGNSHWDTLRTALMGVVQKASKYDKDGIDVHFMNDESASMFNARTAAEVAAVFDRVIPSGSTPTGMRLDDILRPYVDQCEDAKASRTSGGPRIEMPKPMVLVIATDGRADDSDLVKECIIEFAQRLDDIRAPPFQLGIQFLQIGNDPDAAEFLQELDDGIKAEAEVRDMVDTTSYQGRFTTEFLLQVLLGSVNRRIDDRR